MFKNTIENHIEKAGSKSVRTRKFLTTAAFELFKKKGFEQTTMRDIAKAAQLTVGASYYYFESKEEIVLEFYRETYTEFLPQALAAMGSKSSLIERLHAVLESRLSQLLPYRESLASISSAAFDPKSILSPLHARNAEIKKRALDLYQQVFVGSDSKVPARLAKYLPRLFWLYHLAIIALWVRDSSAQQKKTTRLVERSESLIGQALRVANLPLMGMVLNPLYKLLEEIFEDESKEEV